MSLKNKNLRYESKNFTLLFIILSLIVGVIYSRMIVGNFFPSMTNTKPLEYYEQLDGSEYRFDIPEVKENVYLKKIITQAELVDEEISVRDTVKDVISRRVFCMVSHDLSKFNDWKLQKDWWDKLILYSLTAGIYTDFELKPEQEIPSGYFSKVFFKEQDHFVFRIYYNPPTKEELADLRNAKYITFGSFIFLTAPFAFVLLLIPFRIILCFTYLKGYRSYNPSYQKTSKIIEELNAKDIVPKVVIYMFHKVIYKPKEK